MHLVNDNKQLEEILFAIANIFPFLIYFGCFMTYVVCSPIALHKFPVVTVMRFSDYKFIFWS